MSGFFHIVQSQFSDADTYVLQGKFTRCRVILIAHRIIDGLSPQNHIYLSFCGDFAAFILMAISMKKTSQAAFRKFTGRSKKRR